MYFSISQIIGSDYNQFQTEHVLRMLQRVYCKLKKSVHVTLQYNGGLQSQMHYWLDRKLWELPCVYRPQSGDSLGDKLKLAVKDSFNRGNRYVVVIGNKKSLVVIMFELVMYIRICLSFSKIILF